MVVLRVCVDTCLEGYCSKAANSFYLFYFEIVVMCITCLHNIPVHKNTVGQIDPSPDHMHYHLKGNEFSFFVIQKPYAHNALRHEDNEICQPAHDHQLTQHLNKMLVQIL